VRVADGGSEELDESLPRRAFNSATSARNSSICCWSIRTTARASGGHPAIISSVTTIAMPHCRRTVGKAQGQLDGL